MDYESYQDSQVHPKNSAPLLCQFIPWLKLNQINKICVVPRQDESHSKSKRQEIQSAITTSENDMNTILFHSFKKFNSFEFKFQKVFSKQQTNFSIAKNIDLYDELVVNNKDFCLLVIGGVKSGIQSLCESQNKDGLFSLLLCSLFDRIESVAEKKVQKVSDCEFVSNLKLTMKFVVISNEKFFDLNSPKYKLVLKDNKSKYILSGCQIFQPTSVYDITLKMQQMSKNRRLIYPESIMLIEGELSFDKPSIFGEISSFTRSFNLIQWQKSLNKSESKTKNANNNLSLLNLNMCLYELYKGSCQSAWEFQKKSRKMWSIFRNSSITKILKNCIQNCRRLILFGCVALDQDEQQIYQTLMICKNAVKIQWKEKEPIQEIKENLPFTEQKRKVQSNNQLSFITGPITRQLVQSQKRQKVQKIDLSKVKQQLKKILKQKQLTEEKKKEKEVLQLFKKQNRKKMQLRNIRYHKQQLRFKQEIKQVCHSRLSQQTNLPIISNQNIDNIKQHSNLHKRTLENQPQQETLKKEIDQIRGKLIKNMQESKSFSLNHSFLKQQIHRLQNEAIDYVVHKQNRIKYLKEEARELKKEYIQNNMVQHKQPQRIVDPRSISASKSRNKVEDQQLHRETKDTREFVIAKSRNERVITQNTSERQQSPIKLLNRKSSLFQKRQVYLKQKIKKEKQKMNNYYDQVAKNFQEYSRVKKEHSI